MDNIKISLTIVLPGSTIVTSVSGNEAKAIKPAEQVINMSEEAYKYFTSQERPYNYPQQKVNWKFLSKMQRVKWHLEETAKYFGGEVKSFQILED